MNSNVKRVDIKALQKRTKKTVSMQQALRGITPFHTNDKKTDNVQNKGYNKD